MTEPPIYLASGALERNRWQRCEPWLRPPTLRVSAWMDRLLDDGFDGVELWENHALAAGADEWARLVERASHLAVFSAYANFDDDPARRERRDAVAAAIGELGISAVKYNVGQDPGQTEAYRRNLREWSRRLPASCRLWCECHPGSVVDTPEAASAFFADFDAERFGVIAHVPAEADGSLEAWLAAFGRRVEHVHLQCRTPATDPATPSGRARLIDAAATLRRHRYRGGVTIEFTRGTGPDEQIETLYQNAVADMTAFREAWKTASPTPRR